MNEIIIAAISSLSMLIVAAINAYVNLKKKTRALESQNKDLKDHNNRMHIELSAITVLFNHSFLNTLEEQIDILFKETKATRFLILFAVNGKDDFNYVTACFERNQYEYSRGATKRYVRFKIDNQYRKMLKSVEKTNTVHLIVDKMSDSILKRIYQSLRERINYSVIQFIKRIKIDSDNDLLLYSSLATIDLEDFTEDEFLIIQQCYDKIRQEAKHLIIN